MNNSQKLIIIYIGTGKGKTTAAFGLAARCLGHGGKVCICQFIKSNLKTGEMLFFNKMDNTEIYALGAGFVYDVSTEAELREHRTMAQDGLDLMRGKIMSGLYDIVIADEILDALEMGFVKTEDIIDILDNVPQSTSIVLTGRKAPLELIDKADTVTEMVEVKHHFQKGIKAVKGIEF